LAALRFEGARGITTVDFSPPHVYDGDTPIPQIARRIHDLRNDGHDIVTDGMRNGVAVYVLRAAPERVVVDSQGPPAGSLFDTPPAPSRTSAYFDEAA
jgi:hypothetical protein